MATVSAPNHSGSEISVRTTKGGRKLTYALTVIQQPERARACGAGAKSSADRRPVDPPPVVELRIFEGPEQKDITFGYSANFFLFATLEACKPVSHGRMPGAPPQQQPAVLTGLPVSGMAYLDRPTEAGYFIFPDLSVRHEGTYRLSFNLYEETKDECDLDADLSLDAKGSAGGLTGSMDWRLEIKSAPFTVFSAKKFPGLATSTTLSRTVAEQGCRVRIRRDVRLRRREDKTEGDYEEDEYSRARRTPSPVDSVHQVYTRQRSLSHSPPILSADEIASKAHFQQQQYQQQHIQAYAPAPAPIQSSQALNPTHTQYAQQHSYPPAPMQHQQQRYAQPQPQSVPAAPQNYYYPQDYSRDPRRDQYDAQKAAYEKQAHAHAHDEYYRRSSVAYGPPPQAPPAQYNNYPPRRDSASVYPQSQQQYPPRARTPVNQPNVSLAPLKMPPIEPKYDSLSSPAGPLSGGARMPAASHLPSPATYHDRSGYGSYSASAAVPNTPDSGRTGKRPFEQAFSTSASAYSQPLHNGMRPDHHSIVQAANFDDDEDAIDMAALKMSYKRADGHLQERALPTLQ